MAPSAKGKEKVIDGNGSKRKRNNARDEAVRKRNRSVLQFFEDAADVDEDDSDEDSLFGDDFLEDEFATVSVSGSKGRNETAKDPFVSFVPKEEQITEEEFDKMLEERYKPGSSFVTYAEDTYENKKSVETSTYLPSFRDPVIWKVKCMVGRERHSAFCLMQKYVDLKDLGTKLQIISAFALDHVKGFFYIEAEKQSDIYEACNGLSSIYSSRVMTVSKDEISHMFSVRSKGNGISEGMWARVKSGTYKGDLAQVVAVNSIRKKVTVKLIPRIDLQAIAEKFGRGITPHKAVTPAPRLISSSELEEFRPLIQYRRDRDTNKIFEILDGMMLKDGYLYKKVSMDSLNFWGVTPKEDELLKFEPSKNDECNDIEWLSQLYGERKKKRPVIIGKGGGKGEGSSSFSTENKFEVHDLVFFGRKDFGVIIGSEKDDTFKIIKEGSGGSVTVTVQARELKNAEFDKKLFTALDQKLKSVSVNDTVRVLEGPLKDKQGIVKKIYGGILFLYNESEEQNNGYICTKARFCEKVEPTDGACNEKSGEPGSSGFGNFSSPKSPLSPEQSQQEKGGSSKFNRDDDAMFSIGQLLRIRLGPLKGYLCRVLAVRRSDLTVKLDSQHKILSVKCEHVSEVRGRSSGISTGVDTGSVKPFDLLGEQDGSRDWMDGAATATATESGGWNSGGSSTERSSWPAFPTSNSLVSSDPPKSVDEDTNKDDSSWGVKATPSQGSSWDAAGAACETVAGTEEAAGWGSQKKATSSSGFGSGASDSWGKAVEPCLQTTGTGNKDDSWGQAAGNLSRKDVSNEDKSAWNGFGASPQKQNIEWGNAGQSLDQHEGSVWNKSTTVNEVQTNSWATAKKDEGSTGGWGKEASTWHKTVENEDKGSVEEHRKDSSGMSPWNKQDGEGSWSKQSGESSWSKQNVGGGTSSWSKQNDGSTSWSKPDGGSSWNKGDGWASSDSPAGMGNKDDTDQQGSWGRPRAFDGGRGSGGRRGRGGGRGGRDQFGRGRSFGQGQNNNWRNGAQDDHGSSKGILGENKSSWTSGHAGGWKEAGVSGEEKSDQDWKTSSWQHSISTQDSNNADAETGGGGGWNSKKSSYGGSTSGWGQSKFGGKGDAGGDEGSLGSKSSWSAPKACLDNTTGDPDNGNSGGWNSKKSSEGMGGSSSGWGATGNNTGDADDGGGSSWNNKKSSVGGSSSGWGHSNLGVTRDAGGNQGSWGRKSNWGAPKTCLDSSGDAENDGGGGWNSKKSSQGGASSVWGQSQSVVTTYTDAEKGGGVRDTKKSSEGGSSSGWGQSKVGGATDNTTTGGDADNSGGGWNNKKSSEEGSSSGWGQSKWDGATNNTTGDADNSGGAGGSWNIKKSFEGGSSSGWSQNKWGGKADGDDGNQGSWGSKRNWSSENNVGGSDQTDTFGDKGRGGSWRGGRFGGGSDCGGFRGSGDRGGFVGRGRSDRGGFGGRGRGRRNDWNNNNDSGEGGSSGWKSEGVSGGGFGGRGRGRRNDWNKNNDSGEGGGSGWKSEGAGRGGFGGRGRGRRDSWNDNNDSGEGGSSGWKNEGAAGGGFGGRGRGRRDSWNNNNDSGEGGNSGWKSEGTAGGGFGGRGRGRRDSWNNNNDNDEGGSSGWKSEGAAVGGFGGRGRGRRDSWNNSNDTGEGGSSGWKNEGAAGGGFGGRGRGRRDDWNSNNESGEGGSSGWKNGGAAGGGDGAKLGGWNNNGGSDADGATNGGEGSWKAANSSGVATSSAWNQTPASRVEGAAGSSWGQLNNESNKGTSWGQPDGGGSKGSSWDQPTDGSSKGGW